MGEMAGVVSTRGGPVRLLWLVAGLLCAALGGVGVVVPGLPSTVFFILAASCFTRSSPRLEAWVLGLPGVGGLVRDYRAGLGMPHRAKVAAITAILAVGGLSAALAVTSPAARSAILAACAVGVAVITWRIPTRR
jgi:uncharacterized protein